jgi:hypothetical protein
MRKSLVLATLLVLCCSLSAFAGVPDPARSGCELKGQGSSCQFRFNATGGLDCMTVCVTLRDAFDTPVGACSTSAGISLVGAKPGGGACAYAAEAGAALCSCDGLVRGGVTNGAGVIQFVWKCLGGRGIAQVCITAHCVGTIEIGCKEFHFSSPDLDASCQATNSTGIIDLGIWAGCLTPAPPCESSDYDCSCGVGIIDLGVFASGLQQGCNACPSAGDSYDTGVACDDNNPCGKKFKVKNLACPDGGPGFCKKVLGKKSSCVCG